VKNLMPAIYNLFNTANALNTSVNGRMYFKSAPAEKIFPFIVYDIITDVPQWTFTSNYEDVTVQFDIFCIKGISDLQIETILDNLENLYDDSTLTVASNTFLYMWRQNLITTIEDMTTTSGNKIIEHWSVDYAIKMRSN